MKIKRKMNTKIPILTYDILNNVKYGDKYIIPKDSNRAYYCFQTNEDNVVMIRAEEKNGTYTIINKERSKLLKDIVGWRDDFEIIPMSIKNVQKYISKMEAQI